MNLTRPKLEKTTFKSLAIVQKCLIIYQGYLATLSPTADHPLPIQIESKVYIHNYMNQLFYLSPFLARDAGGQVDISTTTEKMCNRLHQLVKDAAGQETVCQSSDGTLVKGTFEGLTCDEVYV